MSARISFKANDDPSAVGAPAVYSFELDTRKLLKDGLPLTSLSPQAATMLRLLLSRPGEVVSDNEIASALWPSRLPEKSDQRIRDLISLLRKPLADSTESPRFIERIRQEGYLFVGVIIKPSVEEAPPLSPVDSVAPGLAAQPTQRRWLPAAGIAAVLVGFSLLAIGALQKARSESRRIQTELLWHGPGVGRLGDVSPDGRILCYTDPESEVLRARNLYTGETWAITSRPPKSTIGGAQSCVFSHDGNHLAYRREMGSSQEIHVVSVNGTGDRILTRNQGEVYTPLDWSPDGRRIACIICRPHDQGTILLLNASTGFIEKQISVPECLNTLRFSADGQSIAYDTVRSDGANGRIGLLPSDFSSPPVTLATDSGVALVGWTANDSGIVYTINSSNHSEKDLYFAALQGQRTSPPQRLLSLTTKFSKTLAITRKGHLVYAESTSQRDCYVTELDFSSGALVTQPDLLHLSPQQSILTSDWSPDGSAVVLVPYASSVKGSSQPSLTHVRTGGMQRTFLHRTPGFMIDTVRWQPDGRGFLLSGVKGNSHSGIYSIRLSDSSMQALRESPELSNFYWGPIESRFDGSIYYKLRINGREPAPLYVMKNGQPLPDKQVLPSVYRYALSSDGRQLVYSSFDAEDEFIRILDLKTASDREIHREPRNGRIYSVAFTADSNSIIYAQRGQLWRLSSAGGTPHKLPLNAPVLRDLRPHPDGRQLAYTAGDPDTSDLWVMHNVIP